MNQSETGNIPFERIRREVESRVDQEYQEQERANRVRHNREVVKTNLIFPMSPEGGFCAGVVTELKLEIKSMEPGVERQEVERRVGLIHAGLEKIKNGQVPSGEEQEVLYRLTIEQRARDEYALKELQERLTPHSLREDKEQLENLERRLSHLYETIQAFEDGIE